MSKRRKTWAEKHPRAITDQAVRAGVTRKVEKMQNELRRNPNNAITAKRLSEFKTLHAGKLK